MSIKEAFKQSIAPTLVVAMCPYLIGAHIVDNMRNAAQNTIEELAHVEEAHAADPCGLDVVVCEGEELGIIAPIKHEPVHIPPVNRNQSTLERIAFVKSIAYPDTVINRPVTDAELENNARIIREAATRYGVNPELAVNIAWCESRLSHTVVNKLETSTASGLFQIVYKTFLHINNRAGFNYTWEDRLDPNKNAEMAMWLMSNEGTYHWDASGACWK